MFDLYQVIGHVKKLFTRRDFLIALALILAYFLTRLVNLDRFPIFSDEGIYIHWAKLAWHDASWRFVSLTDGKQPLQTWGTIPFLKVFPNDALLAGRLFAVSTGFVALAGIFTTLFYLFGKKAAYIGSFLYIFTPYFLFYDRMALVDSGVNASVIWILFFSILLARTLRLDVAIIFGIVGGFGLLAKSSVRIFIGLSGLGFVFFYSRSRKFWKMLVNFLVLIATSGVISLIIYNVQRLSPFMHFISEKNKTFVMTFGEFVKTPFANVANNFKIIPQYVIGESAYLLPLIGIYGLYLLYKNDRQLFIYLTAWIIFPYLVVLFLSKVIFPRYLIFFPTFFLVAASYALTQVKDKVKWLIIGLFMLSVIYFDYTLVFDYKDVPFPPIDRGQYVTGDTAGWGAKEIMDFAREKSQEKHVVLVAEGNFGLIGDVLDTYLRKNDNISINAYWPLEAKEINDNEKELKNNLVYIVFSHRSDFPPEWPIKLVKKYDKPEGKSAFYLFEYDLGRIHL